MTIRKVLTYKELKKLVKGGKDFILKNVDEVSVKESTSDRSMYVRLACKMVRFWDGLDGVGLWISSGDCTVFISRGYVVVLMEASFNE